MSEQAEQLILDYLRRVGDAAYGSLRTDQRLDFLQRLRARIDELRGRSSDPEQVRRVLQRFGEPAALVARERERLKPAPVPPQSTEAAPVGEAAEQQVSSMATGALEHTQRETWVAPEDVGGGPVTQPIPVVRTADGSPGVPSTNGAPGAHQDSGPDPSVTQSVGPPSPRSAAGSPQARPRHTGPPLYEPRSARENGRSVPLAAARMMEQLPPELRGALRGGAVEAVGIALVGVGGLLLPLPLWFIGAVVVVIAVGWSVQDKLVGLLPPPVLALFGSGGLAVLNYGGLAAYVRTIHQYGWPLFRVGAAAGAGYLAARLLAQIRSRRGDRAPWRRINPNARDRPPGAH